MTDAKKLEKEMSKEGIGTLVEDTDKKHKQEMALEIVKGVFGVVIAGLGFATGLVTLAASKNDVVSAGANLKAASYNRQE